MTWGCHLDIGRVIIQSRNSFQEMKNPCFSRAKRGPAEIFRGRRLETGAGWKMESPPAQTRSAGIPLVRTRSAGTPLAGPARPAPSAGRGIGRRSWPAVDHLIDNAEFLGFHRRHIGIPLQPALDRLDRLPG